MRCCSLDGLERDRSSSPACAKASELFVEICELENTVRYARTNVIGSRTSFVIASVRSSIHLNICI